MPNRLNKDVVNHLLPGIVVPPARADKEPAIVHFGIGGFHRSHQAFALQKLIRLSPDKYGEWQICGVCIMPGDADLVKKLKQQDLYYSLKMSGEGEDEVMVINSISHLLFGGGQHDEIINRIARPETKIVSFTITEGGYNLDEATGTFNFSHPDIQSDLTAANPPKTIFGYLGHAIRKRKEQQLGALILLSCDNVQENGNVLKKALTAYLNVYDAGLLDYANESLIYPNSMVDRITPQTTDTDKDNFSNTYGYRDECLVTSEKYFQWVIEKDKLFDFPPLEMAGVEFVDDVKPYERMKLSILNGGHSLAGFIGEALNYTFIHEAINDPVISTLFDLYAQQEVIPALNPLKNVDYSAYVTSVKNRFSNRLIKDSVYRIISGSTAKVPKFILPVLLYQSAGNKKYDIGALIIAAWWHYLDSRIHNNIAQIEDPGKGEWASLFNVHTDDTPDAFIRRKDVFGAIADDAAFQETFKEYAKLIKTKGMNYACEKAIKSYA